MTPSLNRLMGYKGLGQAAKRPDYYTPAERALKRQQRAKRVQRLRE